MCNIFLTIPDYSGKMSNEVLKQNRKQLMDIVDIMEKMFGSNEQKRKSFIISDI